MKRRQLLRTTAAATALGAVAGCTQGPGNDGTENPTDDGSTDSPTETPPPTESGSPASSGSAWGESGVGNGYSYSVTFQSADCTEGRGDVEITRDEDANAVVIDGTIGVSNPCHTASVDAIEYDADAGSLSVSIATRDDSEDGEMCAQCLATIPYEGEVTFDDGLPDEVSVSHDTGSGWSAAWASESAGTPRTDAGTTDAATSDSGS